MSDQFELLPPDDTITVADDLEAAAQAAQIEGREGPGAEEDSKQPFGRGWAFDFSTGQFRHAGSAPAGVRGLDQLRMWIEKTLRTARLAHPMYSDNYGVDQPYEAIGQVFSPAMAGRYAKAIEEALMVHDRISAITDMEFTGGLGSEVLEVSFTVVTDEDQIDVASVPVGRPL